jgi:formate hydrogenlyase transcriptional activator
MSTLQSRPGTDEISEFETLVSDLVARFVNLAPDQVDDAIVDSLRQIVVTLGLDRGALWQFGEGGEDLFHTHLWARPEFAEPPPRVSARQHIPWLLERIRANQATWFTNLDQIPGPQDRESMRRFDTKSGALLPLSVDGHVLGALSFGAMRRETSWSPEIRRRLTLMATVFAHSLARRQSHLELQKALSEIDDLRRRLDRENVTLRQEVSELIGPRTIAAESRAVRVVLTQIESVAATNATVLLLGETGSGKEVFAQAIHDLSKRRNRPMVRVNCAAIPAALIENELFGRERGAYTGALSQQIGRFELAHGSTLFLDEIGELPLESQVKLLRVVQDRVLERLGSSRPINIDVRLIAATNRDLERAVAERTFREDLYYRLNVFPIRIPPLRERQEDIPVLVWTFVEEYSKAFGKRVESISKESLAALQQHPWHGNVRELRNLIERAVIISQGPHLVIDVPSSMPVTGNPERTTLTDVEHGHIRRVLERVGWRVRGSGGAAEVLGMKPTTLDSRMVKLGIRRPH